ncbi:MAG TPA: hypothetical protein HA362_02420, partial [Nanoarchaeota archaeon]|nr:hypothetical protein [Nanoarchaeota archaeon]
KYFCAEVSEEKDGYHLKNALEINRTDGSAEVAKAYLDAELRGTVRDITVGKQSLESIAEAVDESKMLDVLKAYLPEAEKRAYAKATLSELGQLVKALIS